jgi:hypothetical protein
MVTKTTLLWGFLLVSVSSACDDLRMPRASSSADSAAGQTAPRASPRPASAKPTGGETPVNEAVEFDRIRSGLRRLVVAEETFFAENGTYTNDLERLQYKPAAGGAIRFLWVSGTGWAASGTHEGMTGKDCVIFVGRDRGAPTTLKYVRSGKEGVPVCDAAAAPRPAPRAMSQRPAPPAPPASTAAPAPAAPAPTAPAPTVPGGGVADTTSALDAVNPVVAMKVDLRNLVRSQQTYYAQQGLYARSTEPFALQYLWHRGVTVTILSADFESWSARATHASWHGRSCVIWFGPVPTHPATAMDKRVPDAPSEPACDQ